MTIGLTGMAGGDYDLYLYSGTPDANGNPVILAASATAGTNVNESIAYTPGTSQRAYVFVKRVTGSGGFTLSVSDCQPPEPPTSAASDRDDLCPDDPGTIQLSVTGGSGDGVRWFDDACGGNSIGTGNPLTIASPTATTTYYARWETACGESSCASVTVNVRQECQPPVVQAAVSRRTHGTAGGLDIDLLTPSGTSDVAVEDRVGGPQELHVWFDEPIFGAGGLDPSDVSVTDSAGSAISVGPVSIAGNELTIQLSGAADAARVRVRFPGIRDAWGNLCADTFCFGVLEADANASGAVNAFDLTRVRAYLGQPVSQTYVREDVNASGGTINAFDLTVVRARLGHTLAGSCPP